MKPVFTLQLHISLRLTPIHPRYESLAQAAPPLVFSLPRGILLGGGLPPHHGDLGLAEPTVSPCLIQAKSLESLLLLVIFIIVVFTFIIFWGFLFFRG